MWCGVTIVGCRAESAWRAWYSTSEVCVMSPVPGCPNIESIWRLDTVRGFARPPPVMADAVIITDQHLVAGNEWILSSHHQTTPTITPLWSYLRVNTEHSGDPVNTWHSNSPGTDDKYLTRNQPSSYRSSRIKMQNSHVGWDVICNRIDIIYRLYIHTADCSQPCLPCWSRSFQASKVRYFRLGFCIK